MQIFAASCVEAATLTSKWMGKHLSQTWEWGEGHRVAGHMAISDYALMVHWWWLAHDLGNNLYANAHADAKCPAARKQETNYAREQLWNSIKPGASLLLLLSRPRPHPQARRHHLTGQEQ